MRATHVAVRIQQTLVQIYCPGRLKRSTVGPATPVMRQAGSKRLGWPTEYREYRGTVLYCTEYTNSIFRERCSGILPALAALLSMSRARMFESSSNLHSGRACRPLLHRPTNQAIDWPTTVTANWPRKITTSEIFNTYSLRPERANCSCYWYCGSSRP